MADRRSLQPRKLGKQRRAVETRARILEAAAHVFAEHGYAAGTTNRVAERAAVSIGSLYQYFPNKDAMLVELVHRHLAEGTQRIGVLLAEGSLTDDLEEVVTRFVQATLDNHIERPTLHQVLFEEAPRPPELLRSLHEAETWLVEAVRRALDDHPEVTVGDTETAARLVVATIESVVHRYIGSGMTVPVARFRRELVAMVTRYLRGDP